ncbi:hypothetical protein WR25_16632 [Diploscapter pachys]|uniref:Uncharacterized protein n=1 Tax=Diploscapter pachys TaxID=2018661 RepID=A0A2A2KGB1_9BILA|nr:hypothetical protein WR25_16632 [Diploscapter pachys]
MRLCAAVVGRPAHAASRAASAVIRTGIDRRQQHEHQIDGQIVDRVEFDRLGKAHEDAGHRGQIGQARMRDGDSAAKAGRADLFTRRQQFGGQATVDAQALGRGRKLREQGLFMRDGDVLIDRLGAQQIAEVVHPGARACILEQQGGGVAQIEHHHRIRHAGIGDVDARFGDDERRVAHIVLARCRLLEQRIARIVIAHVVLNGRRLAGVPVFQAAHVATQLLLDLFGCPVEREVRLLRLVAALQHQTLHDVDHDIAAEADVMRPLAKRHFGRNGAREMLGGDTLKPVAHMILERVAGCDLMTRNPDIHRLLH